MSVYLFVRYFDNRDGWYIPIQLLTGGDGLYVRGLGRPSNDISLIYETGRW